MSHAIRLSSLVSVSLLALTLSACSKDHVSTAVSPAETADVAVVTGGGPDCVPLPDGYYMAEGGLFSPVQPLPQQDAPRVAAPVDLPDGWVGEVQTSFAGLGFPWMAVQVREDVATLTGLAPDRASKERALDAGTDAIMSNEEGKAQVELVVDGIAIEGEERALGAPLAKLASGDSTLSACQTAFRDTLENQQIRFQSNSAVITEVNARLLDALSGVARLCDDYDVEVAGHTSARGSDSYNLDLSQKRADAVRFYLTERGVPERMLVAVGYGESRLIDRGNTPEAHARNQRTEFIVKPRAD